MESPSMSGPPRWSRAFVSFENTIFLLASCLMVGGTLYLVATIWGHVPTVWRSLFLEAVVLFYGTGLLAAAHVLDRRLGPTSAAHFLSATSALTSVGAAIIAGGAFRQSGLAGLAGAALAAAAGVLDARAVLRLRGRSGRAALVYGAALGALAGVGAFTAAGHAAAGGGLLLAAILLGAPLWLACGGGPTLATGVLAAALPAAALLLVIAGWLPGWAAAPAIVAAGSLVATPGVGSPALPAGWLLVLLQGIGLGLAAGHAGGAAATLLIGLAIVVMRWRTLRDGSPREATWLAAWGGALWCGLAFTSAAALGCGLATAAAVAATAALALVLARPRVGRLVGTVAVPLFGAAALAAGAPGAWVAMLAAGLGIVHLLRPIVFGKGGPFSSRPLGPPALIGALALAVLAPNGAYAALIPGDRWPLVLLAGVTPLVGWVAWRGRSRALAVQAIAGVVLVAAGGQALPSLALASVLLLAPHPAAVVLAAGAALPLALLGVSQLAWPEPIAAALLLCAAALWWRRLPDQVIWLRWLGMPCAVVAVCVAALAGAPGHAPWLPAQDWTAVAAAAAIPFAIAAWRGAPACIQIEVMVLGGLVAGAALVSGAGPRLSPAPLTAISGLVALACGLAAAHRRGGRTREAAWVAALSIAPLLIAPPLRARLAVAPALVGAAAMVALGAVSRRLRAPAAGGWALAGGLAASWWLTGAVAQLLSAGRPPVHILPVLAVVTALYGTAVILDVHRAAAAGARGRRRLATAALALAAAFTLTGARWIVPPGTGDVCATLAGLVALAALALVLAFRHQLGWPVAVAESALAAAYAYLRLRTPWLSGFGAWDGVVAAAGGFACLVVARWLRRERSVLGARESAMLGVVLSVAPALLLRPSDPLTGLGPLAGAAVLARFARRRPAYGCLAGLLLNASLPALWARLDVSSPAAYALPAGATLAVLGEIYARQLGARAGALRTVAAMLSFAATSWEMFRCASLWPAAVLAASAVAAVLGGIAARARSYVALGFAALVLDIVVNVTRWGIHDRLVGGALGVAAGVALFALGIGVSRHREQALFRYRRVRAWPW
jgi:hypothetical protein